MRLPSWHRIWQVGADALLLALAWYLAFLVRFDQGVPLAMTAFSVVDVFAVVVGVQLAVFVAFGLYQHWWRYVSIRDMWRAILAVTVGSIAAVVIIYLWRPVDGLSIPRGIVAIYWLFALAFITGVRLLARTLIERPGRGRFVARGKEALIVGAGDAGQLIIREMLEDPEARVHADRHRRRRPAQAEHPPPRRARPGHDGPAAAVARR